MRPDFVKLWMGQSISVFGSLIGRVALPMMVVLMLQATPAQMSALRAVEVAPALAIGLLAGVWVDRLPRRTVMIAADVGRALLMGSIPLAYALSRLSMQQVYVVAFTTSLLTILFDVAYRAYLPALVAPDELAAANSRLEATASIAEISGFGLSGLLVQVLTAPVTILLDALSFLVSVGSLLLIRQEERSPPLVAEQERTLLAIGTGTRTLFAHPILRALAIADTIQSLAGNIIGTLIYHFVLRELHVAPAIAGATFAVGGVSSLIGALVAVPVSKRFGLGRTMLLSALLPPVSTLCMALAGGPLWLVVLLLCVPQLVGDGAMTVKAIHSVSLVQTLTPGQILGRVHATLQVMNLGASLVGILLGGILGEVVGLRGAILVAVAIKLAAALWLYLSPVRTLRSQPGSAA